MSKIQNIIYTLKDVFEELQVNIAPLTLETITIIIHKSLTLKTRNFHTLEHIFTLAETENPIHALAAFFHDLVYYQVDHGFQPEVWHLIDPYITLEKDTGDIFIVSDIPPDDHIIHLTLDIFGFVPRQKLSPFAGLNEYLSALAMNKLLAGIVSKQDLARITACVEATIPFRGDDETGQSCFDYLEVRLNQVNHKFQLSLSSDQIQAIVRSAVHFANKDVENFAAEDPAYFLDNTWKLLPETNQPLQLAELYSIKDFRLALQKMAGFFDFLNPDNIFHRYRDFPSEMEFNHLLTLARQNITIARTYLGLKLLPLIILEALADISGGDAPLALFMGDVRQKGVPSVRLEDYLVQGEGDISRDESSAVFRLLNEGRASEAGFDMKNSPLTAFLYKNLDDTTLTFLQDQAKKFIANELSSQAFLEQIPKPALTSIIQACSVTALTRSDTLTNLIL